MESSATAREIEIIKTIDFMESPTLALANALYHEGRLADAVDLLSDHLERSSGDERLATAYQLAIIHNGAGSLYDALQILTEHCHLADKSADHRLLAHFRETLGGTYQLIAERESFQANADRALVQYAAASYHYEQSGCLYVAGCTQSNIGDIIGRLGRFDEAREHFRLARRLLAGHPVIVAQVDMTEVQLCFREGNKELAAYRLATGAMAVFTEHEETRLIRLYTPTLRKAMSDYEAVS